MTDGSAAGGEQAPVESEDADARIRGAVAVSAPAQGWASPHAVALTGILIGGAALRLWGIRYGLPIAGAHPDEMTVVIIATGLLFAGLNPKFFHWPSLWFYAVALLYRIGWEAGHLAGWYRLKFDMYRHAAVTAAPFLITSRLLAATCGTVTIWVVYRLVSRLFDRRSGLASAALLAVTFLHVRDSHFGVTDVPVTMLIVASLLVLSSAAAAPERRRTWIAAGLLAGFAASTKYNGGIVVCAGVAAAVAGAIGATARTRRALAVGLVLYGVSSVAAFLAGTPFAVLDWPHFSDALRFDFTHLEGGHGVDLGEGLIYHLRFSLWYGVGWPLLAAGLAGLVVMPLLSWRKAALLLPFPIAYYAIVGHGHTVFVRYVTPVVPFLCIGAGVLVAATAQRVALAVAGPVRNGRREAFVRRCVVAAAVVLLGILPLTKAVALDRLLTRTDTRATAAAWLRAHAQPDDWLYQWPEGAVFNDFGFPAPARLAGFERNARAFTADDGAIVTPRWLLIEESPLLYTAGSAEILATAPGHYETALVVQPARAPEPAEWFDQQDAWYVPYTNFSLRIAPGPKVTIMRLVDVNPR